MAEVGVVEGGGVSSALGFRASGVACGLKESGGPDVALVVADEVCSAAGVFTRNRVVAAPVVVSREALLASGGLARAVVVNSGNANACTGEAGVEAALTMRRAAATAVGCEDGDVLVLSTGVIGVPLDVGKVEGGIEAAGRVLDEGGVAGAAAARAIMTTDTTPKSAAVRVRLSGGEIVVGGMAKGSGMIHPDMATMLGVVTTDADVSSGALRALLSGVVDRTFNRITVDGDTSTNDAVIVLASGASGVRVESDGDHDLFERGLHMLCEMLAKAIVRDGEGASRFVTLTVEGAWSEADALLVARTIATSPLVKTAFAGGDPNWGRIVAAAGRSGVDVEPGRMVLDVGAGEGDGDGSWLRLYELGMPTDYDEAAADRVFAGDEIRVRMGLGMGTASASVWTCDLTADYVSINAEYRT